MQVVRSNKFIIRFINRPDNVQNVIKVGEVTNEIRMGKFAGNRNLSIGVKTY